MRPGYDVLELIAELNAYTKCAVIVNRGLR